MAILAMLEQGQHARGTKPTASELAQGKPAASQPQSKSASRIFFGMAG
jgi:hypothetical protein